MTTRSLLAAIFAAAAFPALAGTCPAVLSHKVDDTVLGSAHSY